MRPVSGFERPVLQWLFVAIGAALIVTAVAEAIELRRLRGEIAALQTTTVNGRLEREALQKREARERSAREALSLEIGRLRNGVSAGTAPPTLTLSPLARRGATPPAPTVDTLGRTQVLQIRLLLPPKAVGGASYTITVRTWSSGDTIWSRGGLQSAIVDGQAMVTALVTGDVFAAGPYEVSLTKVLPDRTIADVASYEIGIREPTAR